MPVVELVYFNAGGGHRAAAQALAELAERQRRGWTVRLTQLFDVLDPTHRFQAWTGMAPEAYYNARLARGWTLGLDRELRVLQAGIRALHSPLVRRLQRHWLASEPDLVVSLVPNFNRSLGDSLAATLPGVPFATVMTDLADHPPAFWIEPSVGGHLVCGTDRAVAQALAAGMPADRVHRVSGMVLRPAFHEPSTEDRAAERARHGFAAEDRVGAVMFGGHGSAEMLEVARLLPDVPLVLLCGHNQRLAQRLRVLPARSPRVVVGFTNEVPRWLRLADFFVGKPGPGSLSEAVACGLPVIVPRRRGTMPQERYNTQWVQEQEIGVVIRRLAELPAAVRRVTHEHEVFHAHVQAQANRALFEVGDLLQRLLDRAAKGAWPSTLNCRPTVTLPS